MANTVPMKMQTALAITLAAQGVWFPVTWFRYSLGDANIRSMIGVVAFFWLGILVMLALMLFRPQIFHDRVEGLDNTNTLDTLNYVPGVMGQVEVPHYNDTALPANTQFSSVSCPAAVTVTQALKDKIALINPRRILSVDARAGQKFRSYTDPRPPLVPKLFKED